MAYKDSCKLKGISEKVTINFINSDRVNSQATYNEFLMVLDSILNNPNFSKVNYYKNWVTTAQSTSKLKAIDDYLKSNVCCNDHNAATFLNWLNKYNASDITFAMMEKIVTTPVIKHVFNEILDGDKNNNEVSSYANNVDANKDLFKKLLEQKTDEEKSLFIRFYNESIIMGSSVKIKAILKQKNYLRADNISMVLNTDSTYNQTLVANAICNNIGGINSLSDIDFEKLFFALLNSKKMLNVYQHYYDLNHRQEKSKKKN